MNKAIEEAKAQIGTMDVIPGDSHLNNRIKICILMNVDGCDFAKQESAGEG